jgi:hypothetical protein
MERKHQIQKTITQPELTIFLNTINRPEISVTVEDGVVTLSGTVDSEAKKTSARNAVASVLGVKAIINTIKVSNSVAYKGKDNEIAEAILSAMQLSTAFRTENRKDLQKDLEYWEIFG